MENMIWKNEKCYLMFQFYIVVYFNQYLGAAWIRGEKEDKTYLFQAQSFDNWTPKWTPWPQKPGKGVQTTLGVDQF